jgi:hypothetical protein
MLPKTVISEGAIKVISKVALIAGSSHEGKARRASVGSNWVVAICLYKLKIYIITSEYTCNEENI